MIKTFLRFVYESQYDSLSEEIASEIMSVITAKVSNSVKGRINRTLEYTEPMTFSLSLLVFRSKSFDPKRSELFNSVPWEKSNFQNMGFAVDANSFIFSEELAPDPEIEIKIVIDPSKEPQSHQALYYKLLDCVRHEIEHLLQKGTNKQYNHSGQQVDKNRRESESSYKYFLLKDEVPAMVSGMKLSAEKKGIPLDSEFEEYLSPIRDFGFISDSEMQLVIQKWLKFANKHFPDAKISKKYRTG